MCLIIDFYEELGFLRQWRKNLVENLKEKDRTESQRKKTALKKQVTFHSSDIGLVENKRSTKIGGYLEKNKSIAQIYDLLGNLSSYHEDANKKIGELQNLKMQNKLDKDPDEGLELDSVLTKLQAEKDEIDNKIIQFVIKDIVEGKEELFNVISHLEEENKEVEDTITLLEGRVEYLKETVLALMKENQELKKEGGRSSDVVRKSVIEKTVSLVFPVSLRLDQFGPDFSVENNNKLSLQLVRLLRNNFLL